MSIAWFMALSVVGGYLWLAPDPVSLAASRAFSGAVRSGWTQARAKHEELRPVAVHGAKTPAGTTGPARGPRGRATGPRGRTGRPGRPGGTGRSGGPVRAKTAGGPRVPQVPVDQPVQVVYRRAPVWPVVWAGASGAWQGARESVRTARAARREGTDHISRLRRALRAGWTTAGVFTRGLQGAEGGLWARLKAGFGAVASARAQAKADQEAEAARAAQEKEEQEQEKEQARAAHAAQETPTTGGPQVGAPVPAGTTTQQEEVMAGMSGMSGDLENVSDLRGETTRVQAVLDDIADQVAQVGSWAAGLGDRIDEAPFETAGLLAQAEAIAEALSGLQGLDDASDVLTGMDGALKDAEALGEHADEVAAGGNVDAFRAS